jgi:hypothetical protein
METQEGRSDRNDFYSEVVKKTKSVSYYNTALCLNVHDSLIVKKRWKLFYIEEPPYDRRQEAFRHEDPRQDDL